MNRASQGLILAPVLLNILVSHLNNTMESVFTKFTDYTKWGEDIDKSGQMSHYLETWTRSMIGPTRIA